MTTVELIAGRCNYFVTRKKRFCRMTVRTGATYCGEHEPKVDNSNATVPDDTRLRMACPLDPKHTCYISKLEKHLLVCNAKEGELPPYIRKNCNLIEDGGEIAAPGEVGKRSLALVSDEILKEVIAIVEKIYNAVISGNISESKEHSCHPSVAGALDSEGRGDNTRRHLLQTSSLIHILQDQGLLMPGTCYVELGAGKGHLSFYLARTVNSVPDCSVLLVDRASHRHKQDNKLREDMAVQVARIRADISDLRLSKVDSVSRSSSLVAVSKHLCGVATDLALNCVTNPEVIQKAGGLVMATCCHHRCVWGTYVGRSFLEENNVTQSQFNVICGLVSWATCGSGLSRERRAQMNNSKQAKKAKYEETSNVTTVNNEKQTENNKPDIQNASNTNRIIDNDHVTDDSDSDSSNDSFDEEKKSNKSDSSKRNVSITKHLGLTINQREDIGFKAKAILDWGRLLFLRSKSFDTNLCFYVDKSLSPENVCIVAVKNTCVANKM